MVLGHHLRCLLRDLGIQLKSNLIWLSDRLIYNKRVNSPRLIQKKLYNQQIRLNKKYFRTRPHSWQAAHNMHLLEEKTNTNSSNIRLYCTGLKLPEWKLTQKRKLKANRRYFRQMVPHVSLFSLLSFSVFMLKKRADFRWVMTTQHKHTWELPIKNYNLELSWALVEQVEMWQTWFFWVNCL